MVREAVDARIWTTFVAGEAKHGVLVNILPLSSHEKKREKK